MHFIRFYLTICIFSQALAGICPNNGGPGPAGVDNTAFENAMEKAKQKLEELKSAEAEHDIWFQKQLGDQCKLAVLIQQLALIDLDKIPPEKIVQILKQAFAEIQNIKTQWSAVRSFFLSVSLQADVTKELIGSRFVSVIEEALANDAMLSTEDREFFVELVLAAAEEIDQNAAVLYLMAKTYYDISRVHMMHQIAGIGRFLALDNNDSRRQALRTLENDTLVTSTKVTNMVQERQLAYKLRLNDRKNHLQIYLNNAVEQELGSNIG